MPRIVTDQPSSGKPLILYIPTSKNSGFVGTSWGAIENAEAPYFSVPSTGELGSVADPLDATRDARPGEIYFETPLGVLNTTATARWVQIRVVLEGTSGQQIELTPQIPVPGGETIYLPIQGLRLLKTNLANSEDGGRLQIRSEVNNALRIFGSAVELEAQSHAPDSE